MLIDLENQTLNDEPIERWEVWFSTVKGTTRSLEEAVQVHKDCDFPPEIIKPVSVAISKSYYEVVLP